MSSTIQGSKSINYNKEDIDGIPLSGDYMQHMSVQEVAGKRGAADVVIHGTTVVSTGHSIEIGSARRKIVSTAHGAKQGWIMRPMSGNSDREEIAIVKIVDANTFIISTEFDMAIADTFDILRSVTPNYTEDGDLYVSVSGSGPIQFELDGSVTTVSKDTVTPGNSVALPIEVLNTSGVPQDLATEATVQTIADAIAIADTTPSTTSLFRMGAFDGSEDRAIKSDGFGRLEVLTVAQAQTATFVTDATVTTTPETFIAPAGAFAALIETDDTNVTNTRVVMGGLASTTTGIQFQGGRSELYQGGSNISYCMESGTGKISVQWFIRP